MERNNSGQNGILGNNTSMSIKKVCLLIGTVIKEITVLFYSKIYISLGIRKCLNV